VRDHDRRIRTLVVQDRRYRGRKLLFALRRTLVFSPIPLSRFRPLRGTVFQGRHLGKSGEYRALEQSGIAVPRWRHGLPDPLEGFGPYVVIKPNRGRRGHGVKIMRRARASHREKPDTIAQEFIYTGPFPISYRVTTFFGRILWAVRFEASHDRTPLPNGEAFGRLAGHRGVSIVATARGCRLAFCDDPEIIALGERAHAAFPKIPLLGVDIVKEQETGKLYVIEVNAQGWVWHFSSPVGLELQRTMGARFEDQFDGIRKAAAILAEKTRACAR